jgi:hypothetical protein
MVQVQSLQYISTAEVTCYAYESQTSLKDRVSFASRKTKLEMSQKWSLIAAQSLYWSNYECELV